MSSRGGRGEAAENGTAKGPNPKKIREIIERIKEATQASDEDITTMLMECNYDVHETTIRLIDNPFSQVKSKKDKAKTKKKEDDRGERKTVKDSSGKVLEVRRPAGGTSGRSRGGKGGGGGAGGTTKPPQAPPAKTAPPADLLTVGGGAAAAAASTELLATGDGPQLSPPAPTFSRAPGHPVASSQPATSGGTWADKFKQPQRPAPAPAPVPAPALQEAPAPSRPANGVAAATINPDDTPVQPPSSVSAPPAAPASAAPASIDVPVPAPARPGYQPAAASNPWGKPPGQPAGPTTAQQNLASSLLSALNGPAAPAPAESAADGGGGVGAVGGDPMTGTSKASVILPPSAQMTDTDRDVRLQFGQFSIGTDFGSTLTSSLSLDGPDDSGALGRAPGASVAPMSSSPRAMGAFAPPPKAPGGVASAMPDYAAANRAAYSAFNSQPPVAASKAEEAAPAAKPVDAAASHSGSHYGGYGAAGHGYQNLYAGHTGYGPSTAGGYGSYEAAAGAQYDAGAGSTTDAAKAQYEAAYHSYGVPQASSGLKNDYGAAGSAAAAKYGGQAGSVAAPSGGGSDREAAGVPGAASQMQPAAMPQANAFTTPGLPPGAMAQYGYVPAQYPMFASMGGMPAPAAGYYGGMGLPPNYGPHSGYGAPGAFAATPQHNSSSHSGYASYQQQLQAAPSAAAGGYRGVPGGGYSGGHGASRSGGGGGGGGGAYGGGKNEAAGGGGGDMRGGYAMQNTAGAGMGTHMGGQHGGRDAGSYGMQSYGMQSASGYVGQSYGQQGYGSYGGMQQGVYGQMPPGHQASGYSKLQ